MTCSAIRAWSCSSLGGANATLDSATLLLENAIEALVELVQNALEVRALQLLLTSSAEAFHDPSQAGDVAAARAVQATLHEPLERPTDVPLGQDVVRQRIQHVV